MLVLYLGHLCLVIFVSTPQLLRHLKGPKLFSSSRGTTESIWSAIITTTYLLLQQLRVELGRNKKKIHVQ